jgi:hypothetical protein
MVKGPLSKLTKCPRTGRILFTIMLNVVMLSVIVLSVVMLRVVAPFWLSIQNMTKNNLLKGLDKQIGKTL